MAILTVIQSGNTRQVESRPGDTVLAALQRAGIAAPEAPCGGSGICKKCRVQVDGADALACRTAVTGDHRVVLPEGRTGAAVLATGRAADFPLTPAEGLGAAVDIGTTTVVAHLYDRQTGQLLDTRSGRNAQAIFGADVISRIRYAMETPEGPAALTGAIRTQLRGFLEASCARAGRRWEELTAVTVAGNTVMEHLFAGLSPASLAAAPFLPLSRFGDRMPGDCLGLPEGAQVYLAPAVAGYVGGDTTAGLLAGGAYRAERPVLFLDIGTNGEMALGSAKEGFLCCSAAAGPALEGAAISRGMPAARGSISQVEWSEDGLRVTVLGGGTAAGICGSGLIDALAVMLELGAVDETGRLLPPGEAPEAVRPYIEETGGGVVFRLTEEVRITERDVRQLQLAKAAIAAGIRTLLEEVGLREDQVSALYLAGGFGSCIRRESAAAIGLIPASLLERVVPVGNAAGQGAAAVLLSQQARDDLTALAGNCRYLELSGHKRFGEHYIDCMSFE